MVAGALTISHREQNAKLAPWTGGPAFRGRGPVVCARGEGKGVERDLPRPILFALESVKRLCECVESLVRAFLCACRLLEHAFGLRQTGSVRPDDEGEQSEQHRGRGSGKPQDQHPIAFRHVPHPTQAFGAQVPCGPMRTRTVIATLVATLGVSQAASAQQRNPLRTPTKPGALQLSMGPAFGLDRIGPTQLKIAFDGQYHLDGNALGPALGGAVQTSVTHGFAVWSFLFRFQWDIEAIEGFLIGPFAHTGFALRHGDGDTDPFFELGFGVDLKVTFGQFYAFMRPAYLDILVSDYTAVRYDLLFGGGVTL